MKKEHLKFFPFFLFFESRAINKEKTGSADEDRKMTGFTLDWFLKNRNGSQITEKLPPRQEDWKQKVPTPNYTQPLAEMAQLARQLRMQNMTKKILAEVIHKKFQNIKLLEEDEMCSMGQVQPEKQKEVAASVKQQLDSGETAIRGLMLESHLVAGRQNLDDDPLNYGQSITDACLGFEETTDVLRRLVDE